MTAFLFVNRLVSGSSRLRAEFKFLANGTWFAVNFGAQLRTILGFCETMAISAASSRRNCAGEATTLRREVVASPAFAEFYRLV